jgi:hypothetical protein
MKIAVTLRPSVARTTIPRLLTDICARVVRTAGEGLVRGPEYVHGVEVALDWRERWVGGWPRVRPR